MDKQTRAHSHFGSIASKTTSQLAHSLGLTLVFVVVEAVAGIMGSSLALLADAAHNFTDAIALAPV